jgi:hypothetical protein
MAKPSFVKGAPIETKLAARKFLFPLLILFSFFIFGGVIHHHPDGLPHNGCFLCYLSLQHSDYIPQTPASTFSIPAPLPYVSPGNLPVFPSVAKDHFAIRAPPLC